MKNAAVIALRTVATILIIATFVPLLPFKDWYIRIFDFPRAQLFVMAALILLFFLGMRLWRFGLDKILLMGLVVSLAYEAVNIYPYTSLSPVEVKPAPADAPENGQLSILVANVYQYNVEHQLLVNLIKERNPDLLLTLETDSIWQEALRPATDAFPERVTIPLSNTYGMHLYSKLPLRQTRIRHLLDKEIPSIETYVQLRNGVWVELHAVHPKPPVPTEDDDSKKRDAEIVLVGKEVKRSDYPVIVAGDFNDVAWSNTTLLFQEVSGLLDPRIGRGFYNTFHARYKLLRWPLDHVFHSDHFKLVKLERLPDINSDHFPMMATLSFEPENKYEQKKPQPDEDTAEEATKTIEEGKVEAQEEDD
ncbi:endonuclease/exonuclease/phosphatase family protein [Pontibacter sp. HSC-36F09]|uniref:endonuclease/exonuclease/phosphatase family protein n=1 Tax=Pontibacter sp. HSC-36F09 TaxID=2910966 RepID=UPI00209F1FED|nr:endonuclease/exonuclease/phosphatase family protein [Pontibacter sp. HSC-36F09]MCP2042739.1 endonuclease/exonuclease/phosphatase (EEP) superfamily protein YafD [Pontibacter sp. HSC-36F09]